MKTLCGLLIAAVLSLPLSAEIPWGKVTQGDITFETAKWNDSSPKDPHVFMSVLAITVDSSSDLYSFTVKYRSAGEIRSEVKRVHAIHYSDYGYTGEDAVLQVPVHTGFRLPADAEVLEFAVSTSKLQATARVH